MVIDVLKKFLMRRVVLFKMMKFTPGFVLIQYDYKRRRIFHRDVMLPEEFFIETEKEMREKKGLIGNKLLYHIGKTFTWNFWETLGVGKTRNYKEMERYREDVQPLFEVFYSSSMDVQILAEKLLLFKLRNYIICSKSGTSFFNLGTFAGLFGRTIEDKEIEAVEASCQGLGREYCEIYVGSVSELERVVPRSKIIVSDVENYRIYDLSYRLYNSPIISIPGQTLLDLLNEKIFTYSKGILSLLNRFRFFPLEVSGLHLLEKNLEDLVFKVSYRVGKRIGEVLQQKGVKSLFDLISALGFGIVTYISTGTKFRVRVDGYPYSKLLDYNFPYLQGFIKGILEGSLRGQYRVTLDAYSLHNNLQLLLVIQKLR